MTKRKKKEIEIEKEDVIGNKLTEKQKLFCFHYIKNDHLRGNGTLSYNEAYNIGLDEKDTTREKDFSGNDIVGTSEYDKCYNTCSVNASRLLRKAKIQEEIEKLWNELLNDKKIGTRLAQIIFGGRDNDSLNGIKIYNELNARIEKARQQALNNKEITKDVIPEVKIIIQKNGTSNDDNILE